MNNVPLGFFWLSSYALGVIFCCTIKQNLHFLPFLVIIRVSIVDQTQQNWWFSFGLSENVFQCATKSFYGRKNPDRDSGNNPAVYSACRD